MTKTSSRKTIQKLKKNFKAIVVLGLIVVFIIIMITAMFVVENRRMTSASRASGRDANGNNSASRISETEESVVIGFNVKLTRKDKTKIRFETTPGTTNIILKQYEEDAESEPVSLQTIHPRNEDVINPDEKNISYRFEKAIKQSDIEGKKFKIWLQMPLYTDTSGKIIEAALIPSEEIIIEKNQKDYNYDVIFAY